MKLNFDARRLFRKNRVRKHFENFELEKSLLEKCLAKTCNDGGGGGGGRWRHIHDNNMEQFIADELNAELRALVEGGESNLNKYDADLLAGTSHEPLPSTASHDASVGSLPGYDIFQQSSASMDATRNKALASLVESEFVLLSLEHSELENEGSSDAAIDRDDEDGARVMGIDEAFSSVPTSPIKNALSIDTGEAVGATSMELERPFTNPSSLSATVRSVSNIDDTDYSIDESEQSSKAVEAASAADAPLPTINDAQERTGGPAFPPSNVAVIGNSSTQEEADSAVSSTTLFLPTFVVDADLVTPTSTQAYDDDLIVAEQEAIVERTAREARRIRAREMRKAALAEEKRKWQIENDASISIQAVARQFVSRIRLRRQRILEGVHHLIRAFDLVAIRRALESWKTYSTRHRRDAFTRSRKLLQIHLSMRRQKLDKASVIIQSTYRQYHSLRLLAKLVALRNEAAALRIQQHGRGRLDRKRFRRTWAACVVIQQCFRRYRRNVRTESASVCMQRMVRGVMARAVYIRAKKAAAVLQRWHRGRRMRMQIIAVQHAELGYKDEELDRILGFEVEEFVGGIGMSSLNDEFDRPDRRELPQQRQDGLFWRASQPRESIGEIVANTSSHIVPEIEEEVQASSPILVLTSHSLPLQADPRTHQLAEEEAVTAPSAMRSEAGSLQGWNSRVAQAFGQRRNHMKKKARTRRRNKGVSTRWR